MRYSLLALLICLSAFVPTEVYEAPDPEPTPEETLLVEWMNRFRANPGAEGALILASRGTMLQVPGGIDWEMFSNELKALKAAPPMAMNLQLLECARKHSYYMIQNGMSHDEQAGKLGFVATDFSTRISKAGYQWDRCAENIFRDAQSLWYSHAGFLVDWGNGPGGMQSKRSHRTNIAGEFREVGCGCLPHGEQFSITHSFGDGHSLRFAGGVAYVDKNNNQFYDIGEGVGSVTISASDGSVTATWKSGGYTLLLKGTGPVVLTAEFRGKKQTRNIEPGKDNIKFDWLLPEGLIQEHIAQLLAAVEQAQDSASSAHFRAQIALFIGTRGLALDTEQGKHVSKLTAQIGMELETAQKTVWEAFQRLDLQTWPKVLESSRRAYQGTAAEAWFKDVETAGKAKVDVARFERQSKVKTPERTALAAQLVAIAKQMQTPVFMNIVSGLARKVGTPETGKRQ
jgi:hypothetical protein